MTVAIPKGLLDRIDKLEPLPVTVQLLSEAIACGDVPVHKIAEIVEYDHAVAANILKIANSSFCGGLAPVDNLRDAVIRIGTYSILNLALDHHLKGLRTDAPMYDLTENDLWMHGAAASLAVDEIIMESRKATVPRIASIAALIHDIGKLVIVRYCHADVSELLDLTARAKIPFVEAERRIVGCDHAEVGGAMARKWKFPPEITRAVMDHHLTPAVGATPTLDAVMLANLVAKTIGAGLGAEGMNFALDLQAPRRLGIDNYAFCRATLRTSLRLKGLTEAYGVGALSRKIA